MDVINLIVAGLLGVSLGSFFNVVVSRFGTGHSFVSGRSRCPSCKKILLNRDLVPLLSFLFLGRKCRFCKTSIAWRYFVVELLGGAAGVLFFWYWHGAGLISFGIFAVALWVFFLLALLDVTFFTLPNNLTAGIAILGVVNSFTNSPSSFLAHLGAGFLFAGLFAILYVGSAGQWIGFGDVKLVGAIGLLFGYGLGAVVVVGAIWLASLVGLGLVLMRRATLKTALPLGTFLGGIAVVTIIWYEQIQRSITFFF